jgi:hypothetical protein
MEATERGPAANAILWCASCGDVIGVYEPPVHVVGGIAHKTSRAADPHLARSQPGACYHLACSDLGNAEVVTVG